MTTSEIIAGVAVIGLIINFLGQVQARIKTKKLESNHVSTLETDVKYLKNENKTQWEKIDGFKDEIRAELRDIRDRVIGLNERVKIEELIESLLKKTLNGRG